MTLFEALIYVGIRYLPYLMALCLIGLFVYSVLIPAIVEALKSQERERTAPANSSDSKKSDNEQKESSL